MSVFFYLKTSIHLLVKTSHDFTLISYTKEKITKKSKNKRPF